MKTGLDRYPKKLKSLLEVVYNVINQIKQKSTKMIPISRGKTTKFSCKTVDTR